MWCAGERPYFFEARFVLLHTAPHRHAPMAHTTFQSSDVYRLDAADITRKMSAQCCNHVASPSSETVEVQFCLKKLNYDFSELPSTHMHMPKVSLFNTTLSFFSLIL